MFGWIVTGIWVILNMIIRAGIVRVEFHALVYCFSSLVLSFFLYFLGSVFLSFFSSVSLLIYFCPSLVFFLHLVRSFVLSRSVCLHLLPSLPRLLSNQNKASKITRLGGRTSQNNPTSTQNWPCSLGHSAEVIEALPAQGEAERQLRPAAIRQLCFGSSAFLDGASLSAANATLNSKGPTGSAVAQDVSQA